MDNRKELTRQLIMQSFKEIMLRKPFDKISVANITEEAGIRRPSFYNHFQDKYELLEYIVTNEVILPAEQIFMLEDLEHALYFVIDQMLQDREFYTRAFGVVGQNGFEDAFVRQFSTMLMRHLVPGDENLPGILSVSQIAHFFASCFVSAARSWLQSGQEATARELTDAYLSLTGHVRLPDGEHLLVQQLNIEIK